jgi:hypothetical protein
MDFRDFMAMLVEEADKYRNYFPAKGESARQAPAMTAAERADKSGGFACTAHLTADGKLSDAQTGTCISFTIIPAHPLTE